MPEYFFAAPSEEDVILLAPQVRPEEREELRHSCGMTPQEYLAFALDRAAGFGGVFFSLHGPGGILGMGGARPHPECAAVGIPWFIGKDLRRHRRFVARHSRRCIAGMFGRFEMLFNFVGSWNGRSIAWLERTGFTVVKSPVFLGGGERAFYLFKAERSVFNV